MNSRLRSVLSLVATSAASASACHADVVSFTGPYAWYRLTCAALPTPPAPPLFDITRAANDQPSSFNSSTMLRFSMCPGFGSCEVGSLDMSGAGMLRSTVPTPITQCSSTINIFLLRRLNFGDVVGPTPVSNAAWNTTAAHGGVLGSNSQQMLVVPAYIGVRVQINGQFHYGWVRLVSFVNGPNSAYTVSDWAYESLPNTPISVGATTPPCPCDFDGTPGVTSQDFFDFLSCFFAQPCTAADVNHSGAVDSQDFFDFVNCFFTLPGACS